MHARSTTINGDSGAIEAGIAYVRDEVMPMLVQMPGCVGLSMMVDRADGRSIATTSWSSFDAMVASAANVSSARAKAAEIMGGTPVVDMWEIAVMHREHDAHEGSWCRATWLEMTPDKMDPLLDYYRTRVLTTLEDMHGFCSASMMIDRASGRACSTARFADHDALMASAAAARELRDAGAEDIGLRIVDVNAFELAIAHLRVPEHV
jgi:quinol monooxygenase YgiN